MKLENEIYEIVSHIPVGEVMTYGQIAKLVGTSPRHVGNVLHRNIDPENIPCHRVVNSKGEVAKNYAFGGSAKQRQKLISEGVEFANNRVSVMKL